MKFNKKIFFIMTIFTLLLVGCGDKSDKNEPNKDKDKRLQTFYSGGIVLKRNCCRYKNRCKLFNCSYR